MSQFALNAWFWNDTRGQDLIEYALLAGFIVVAAGALSPAVTASLSTILSKVASAVAVAATTGS